MRPGMSRNETMSLKSNGNSAANSPVSTAECRLVLIGLAKIWVQLRCNNSSRGFRRAPRVATGALKLQSVTSGCCAVTAEGTKNPYRLNQNACLRRRRIRLCSQFYGTQATVYKTVVAADHY